MTTELGMYWMPIALAVGLAAAILGPRRGLPLSILGGGYWLVLVLVRPDGIVALTWIDWTAAILGASAIWAMGAWLGGPQSSVTRHPVPDESTAIASATDSSPGIAELIQQFQEWLDVHRDRPDAWPDFGEFIRAALHASCGGQQIRVYSVSGENRSQLQPLRRTDPEENEFPSARTGIVGHVVTSGRRYCAGDPVAGQLIEKLATDETSPCAWCFPIRSQRQTIGVVRVGVLPVTPASQRTSLVAVERLISLCWLLVDETIRSREAAFTDPVAGVLTYSAFLSRSAIELADAYADGEPVAVASIDVEGLRAMADGQRWDFVNEAVGQVSNVLRAQTRADDRIGVFNGSTFLLLLRRVDSTLAILIVQQLLTRLADLGADSSRWGTSLVPRCGLAGSGTEQPDLESLLNRATENVRLARERREQLVSDLPSSEELAVT